MLFGQNKKRKRGEIDIEEEGGRSKIWRERLQERQAKEAMAMADGLHDENDDEAKTYNMQQKMLEM